MLDGGFVCCADVAQQVEHVLGKDEVTGSSPVVGFSARFKTGCNNFRVTLMPRDIVSLACDDCKRRNYVTTKNKRKQQARYEFKKYCRFCRKHTLHKETR